MSRYAPSRAEKPEDAILEAQLCAWLDAGQPVAVVVVSPRKGRAPERAVLTGRRDGVTYVGERYRRRFWGVYQRPGSKKGWSEVTLFAVTEILVAVPLSRQQQRAA